MARKTKEEAEKTYQALLQAAANLFIKNGIAETTLNQIAKEAGVTRGAFYWHFEDKNDVVRALWESYAKPQLEPLRQNLVSSFQTNPVDSLRHVTSQLLDRLINDERLGQALRIVMHNVELSENHTALREYLMEEHKMMIESFTAAFERINVAGLLRTDRAVETIAWGYICLMGGLVEKHFMPGTPLMLPDQGQNILDMYLDGVVMVQPDT
ncbi:TetR family transcriptional regulator [Cohaesibacter gelatinilyticus]|uniref:Transcriptional regulator, TetR family n=1 Tax=Cohaesibacter gelatinilyticus TaxID=372072 RepID=A0A285NHN4_9HYPH|nr:TetR family transcriptional regulator [Cohaesibacter gelatinilyticus]SNZ07386.1 transcriptional regulator, TetR family [Cohaesibacter gelatinilyticus]